MYIIKYARASFPLQSLNNTFFYDNWLSQKTSGLIPNNKS